MHKARGPTTAASSPAAQKGGNKYSIRRRGRRGGRSEESAMHKASGVITGCTPAQKKQQLVETALRGRRGRARRLAGRVVAQPRCWPALAQA